MSTDKRDGTPSHEITNPRPLVDVFNKLQFDLTRADVAERIESLNEALEEHNDTQNYTNKAKTRVLKWKKGVDETVATGNPPTIRQKGIFSDLFLEDMPGWIKFIQSKATDCITPELWQQLEECEIENERKRKEEELVTCRALLNFTNEHGADGIFSKWQEVWRTMKTIAQNANNDADIFFGTQNQHPEFVEDISSYLYFIRGKEWHLTIESLILQKKVAEGMKKISKQS